MSIEEKAKAYDEALERAKKYMAKGYDVLMPEIFPELRESEDEKVRKEIINYLNFAESHNLLRATDYEKKKGWLTYLEKQKYDRMKPIYDARESFESALEKAWNDYHNGYENVDKLEDDYVECAHAKGFREGYLFGLEKQKEQSLRDFIDDFPYSCEQEEQKITATINGEPIPTENHSVNIPLVELSEEDKEVIEHIVGSLDSLKHYVQDNNGFSENLKESVLKRIELEQDWLKSRSSWKLSEEQMNRLFSIIVALRKDYCDDIADFLASLYKQLKKL